GFFAAEEIYKTCARRKTAIGYNSGPPSLSLNEIGNRENRPVCNWSTASPEDGCEYSSARLCKRAESARKRCARWQGSARIRSPADRAVSRQSCGFSMI